MSKSVGKIFEENWKKSVPKNYFYYRPPDQAQSFGKMDKLRFSAKSPCDCFIFDGDYFYALELKTVGTKSMSFERTKDDTGIVHKHQIEFLTKTSLYKNAICGFILDFRISEKTYFVNISDFNHMIDNLDKKSFNEKDLSRWCTPIETDKKKLKVNWKYNIEKLFKEVRESYD